MKILYVDDTHTYHRNDELDLELERRGHKIVRAPEFNTRLAREVDVVWVEMVTNNAVLATHAEFKAPLVVRLSAMEIYRKGLVRSVNWRRIDRFLVEGKHLADYLFERWGPRIKPGNVVTFPTGVDMARFPLLSGKPNRRLAVVSQVHWRKGVQLIPDVLSATPNSYRVDLIGKVVDHDARNYLDSEIERRGLRARFSYTQFVWPREKLIRWLSSRTYLLHTSYTEGLSRAVNEAMACGLAPLIHRYRGVDVQYPEEWVWQDPADLVEMLARPVKPEKYRAFVEKHYSLQRAGDRAEALLEEIVR